jgi:hypothetical protein
MRELQRAWDLWLDSAWFHDPIALDFMTRLRMARLRLALFRHSLGSVTRSIAGLA